MLHWKWHKVNLCSYAFEFVCRPNILVLTEISQQLMCRLFFILIVPIGWILGVVHYHQVKCPWWSILASSSWIETKCNTDFYCPQMMKLNDFVDSLTFSLDICSFKWNMATTVDCHLTWYTPFRVNYSNYSDLLCFDLMPPSVKCQVLPFMIKYLQISQLTSPISFRCTLCSVVTGNQMNIDFTW